jgi:UDP-glucose 4-epimerase
MWLVTGGAGYIGSHVVEAMSRASMEVVVIDNLRTGMRNRVDRDIPFVEADICSATDIEKLLTNYDIQGVINLAALKSVNESRLIPEEYKRVNHQGVVNLLSSSVKFNVKNFIQSSSAAVYGNSESSFVDESAHLRPISPYGISKVEAEDEVNKFARSGHGRGISLRYFNVLGSAHASLRDNSKANIVPMVVNDLEGGVQPQIFGDDYPTKDGTCIRDYVHVCDIAQAHVLAAQALESAALPPALNIGTGKGYSVREVMDEIIMQVKSPLRPKVVGRREGDPAELVAKVDLARDALGFSARMSLGEMISSAI